MIARNASLAFGFFLAPIALFCSSTRAEDAPPRPDEVQLKAGEFTLTGPFTHDNLAIYLIHGQDHGSTRSCLTLDDAIQKKAAIVHETRFPHELAIENLSQDAEIYVQAGEVVKGGLPDRTIGADYLIPPKSGYVQVKAFCVDLGRWEARPGESVDEFDSAPGCVAGKLLKFAVLKSANQDQVWWAVKLTQRKLAASAGHSVVDRKWANAYQLAVENPAVQQATRGYADPLASKIDLKGRDVIGCAVVINGKFTSADAYVSHEVFVGLWPRLLACAAVEAYCELPKDKVFESPNFDAMKTAIESVDHVRPTAKEVTRRTAIVTRESKDAAIFESYERVDPRSGPPRIWLHRIYLTKQGYNPPGAGAQETGTRRIIIPQGK
jgi:hypothetical protein